MSATPTARAETMPFPGRPDRSQDVGRKLAECREYAARQIARLTTRQHDILEFILAGSPNKNIAFDIGISQRTVENHRAEIMRRVGVKSLPALARLAISAGWTWADEPQAACAFNHDTVGFTPDVLSESPECQTVAGYRRELLRSRQAESRLREILACDEILIGEQNRSIAVRDQQISESDHALRNNLQMVISLLSLQSRASVNSVVAATLATAAGRIATIARLHGRSHGSNSGDGIALRPYVEDICHAATRGIVRRGTSPIAIDCSDVDMPTQVALSLGSIVNELVTNAAKHGAGKIAVKLEASSGSLHALSVCNEGDALPQTFDASGRHSVGMRIVQSSLNRIGGNLQTGTLDDRSGAQFLIRFH
jgi:two-component sensor histidine kinase